MSTPQQTIVYKRPNFVDLVADGERLSFFFGKKQLKSGQSTITYRRLPWFEYLAIYQDVVATGATAAEQAAELARRELDYAILKASGFLTDEGENVDDLLMQESLFDHPETHVRDLAALLLNFAVMETALGPGGKIGVARKLRRARFTLATPSSKQLKADLLAGKIALSELIVDWKWVYQGKVPVEYQPELACQLPLGVVMLILDH